MVHVGKYTIHGSYGNLYLDVSTLVTYWIFFQFLAVFGWLDIYMLYYIHNCLELKAPKVLDSSHTSACYMGGGCPGFIYIYIYDPGSRFATTPPPPHMVWSQNLRFAAFRMKTLYLQCFLHGGLLARSATLQIRWIFATNLPKTCYLQCFGFDIVE